MKKLSIQGETRDAFLTYYQKEFPGFNIPAYLTHKTTPILLISPQYKEKLTNEFKKKGYTWKEISWFTGAIEWPPEATKDIDLPGYTEGKIYLMNISSLLPIVALDPHPTDAILDAAAAPGGKTLAMITYTSGNLPTLIANDPALPRYKRLVASLRGFGYPKIAAIHHPIQALPYVLTGQFDKILLDAPCSSEKHVFNSKKHLKDWKPNRIQTLAHLQELLVHTLLPLLKSGGRLVYSTCALNHTENEHVIGNVLKKHPKLKLASPMKRKNEINSDFDPMFVATLTKVESNK